MAKFYVQCGPVQVVNQADTVDKAALAAIDQAMQPHLWIYDDEGLTEADCQNHLMLEALLHLQPSIRISEQGFDRDDALFIGTPETIQHWHQLMVSMRRLFVIAGLESRTMASVAGHPENSRAVAPQLPR